MDSRCGPDLLFDSAPAGRALPRELACDIVCGRILFAVSGKNAARIPERTVGTPRTSIGSGCQYLNKIKNQHLKSSGK